MTTEILLDRFCGEARAARLIAGQLTDMLISYGEQALSPGAVHVGRVDQIIPALEAAFVTLNQGRPGFLPLTHGSPLHEGQWITCQIDAAATGTKGPRLTRRIELASSQLVFRPYGHGINVSKKISSDTTATQAVLADLAGGWVLRTRAARTSTDSILAEAAQHLSDWAMLEAQAQQADRPICLQPAPDAVNQALRDWQAPGVYWHAQDQALVNTLPMSANAPRVEDRDLFSQTGAEEALELAQEPRAALPGGGWLMIEPTEAACVIDVNSGNRTEAGGKDRTALETNLAAVPEIARQLRLRNLAGMVLIDFIRMEHRDAQEQVSEAMHQHLSQDPQRGRLHGWSRMGFFELTRRRAGPPLKDQLAGLEGQGYRALRLARAYLAQNIQGDVPVRCAHTLADWLEGKQDTFLAATRRSLTIIPQSDWPLARIVVG